MEGVHHHEPVTTAIAPVAPAVHDIVAEVWQRTLDLPARRGDRLLDALFTFQGLRRSQKLGLLLSDIGVATGVFLPMTVVYESPTAAELARMVSAQSWPPYRRPIRMCDGLGPALFVLPGLGGIGLDTLALIRHFTFHGPIYFNPPRGLDGAATQNDLPSVVADHIAVIRSVQPDGPYWLLGHSWGGLVALEIARVLQSRNEQVAFVGMIDPVLNEIDWTYSAWLEYTLKRSRRHLKHMLRARSPQAAFGYARRLVVPVIDKVARLFGVTRLWPLASNAQTLPPPLDAVWTAESDMIKEYRLQHYSGEVTFFATQCGHAADCDPAKVWPHKVDRLDLQWVPGDHGLTEAAVKDTATTISRLIEAHRRNLQPEPPVMPHPAALPNHNRR